MIDKNILQDFIDVLDMMINTNNYKSSINEKNTLVKERNLCIDFIDGIITENQFINLWKIEHIENDNN